MTAGQVTDLLDRRLLFVTGKGGVGKSTTAAALALLGAVRGKRTLACEVDAKGDLADFFETPRPGFAPERVAPDLWAMAMDTEASLQEYLRLNLRVPPRDIDFEKGENLWSGVLALIYDQRAANDRDLGRISETLNIQYDDGHFQALPQDGIGYAKLVRPSPEAAKIRVLVYDRRSGRLGSITLPLAP